MRSSSGCSREAQGGEQVLHRQRRLQAQPIDARDRNARLVKARNDKSRERASAPQQDEDVAGADGPTFRAKEQLVIQPCPHLLRDPLGMSPFMIGQPVPRVGDLVFTLDLVIVRVAARDRRREEQHLARMAMRGTMMLGWSRQANGAMTDLGKRRVDDVENRRHGPEAQGQRQFIDDMTRARRTRLKAVQRFDEGLRAGALESEDRLPGVTDDEERARRAVVLVRLGLEIVLDDGLDEVPLSLVGVLRLVDQHMVDALVELVADPFGYALGLEKRTRAADQIVEIDHAGQALGGGIGAGISETCFQALRGLPHMSRPAPASRRGSEIAPDLLRQLGISGLDGEQLLVAAILGEAFLRDEAGQQLIDHRGAGGVFARQPRSDAFGGGETGLGPPPPVCLGERPQGRLGDEGVGAMVHDIGLEIARRQPQPGEQDRSDILVDQPGCILPNLFLDPIELGREIDALRLR